MSERNPDTAPPRPDWYDKAWAQRFGVQVLGAMTSNPSALCPDLLRYEQIGEADDLRGRVVRGFFWIMRAWPPRRARG